MLRPHLCVTILACAACLAEPLSAVEISSTYSGATNGFWSVGGNWTPSGAPANGTDTYAVSLPAAKIVNFDLPGATQINDLTLSGTDTQLAMLGSATDSLTILDSFISHGTIKIAGGGSTISAADATSGDITNARFDLSAGGQFTLPAAVTAYTVTTLGNFDLFKAQDAGTVLDLSSLRSLDLRGQTGYNGYWYNILASGGGTIDLSGLEAITMTSGSVEKIHFSSTTGGTIDLSGLRTITGNGFAWFASDAAVMELANLETVQCTQATWFRPAAGAALNLPKLTTLSQGDIILQGGAATLPKAVTVSKSTITLSGGATLSTPLVTDMSNTLFNFSQGSQYTSPATLTTYTVDALSNVDLFKARDAGTVLNFSSLKSLNVLGTGGTYNITASGAGTIDLSGLETITTSHTIVFSSTTGGTIDLSGLRFISGAGMAKFTLTDAGSVSVGQLLLNPTSQVQFTGIDSRLTVAANLVVAANGSLSVPSQNSIQIGGTFYHELTDETKFAMKNAGVEMNGGTPQLLELASLDVGIGNAGNGEGDPGANGNFGLGQLTVGQDSAPTIVHVIDAFDNGNRGTSGREALYLFGIRAPNGLEIKGGATLVLGNYNVYAKQATGWVSLQDELGSLDFKPFGSGYLARTLANTPSRWDKDSGGVWSNQHNWRSVLPSGVGATALFGNVITAPRTVTVDTPVHLGSIEFSGAFGYTIDGVAPINLVTSGGNAAIHVRGDQGNADHTVAVRLNLFNDLRIQNDSTGTLRLSGFVDNRDGYDILSSGTGPVIIEESFVSMGDLLLQSGHFTLLGANNAFDEICAAPAPVGLMAQIAVGLGGNLVVGDGLANVELSARRISANSLTIAANAMVRMTGDRGPGGTSVVNYLSIADGLGGFAWDAGGGLVSETAAPHEVTAPVPEPAAWSLLTLAAMCMLLRCRKRRWQS